MRSTRQGCRRLSESCRPWQAQRWGWQFATLPPPIHGWAATAADNTATTAHTTAPAFLCSTPGKYATKVGPSAYHTCEPCAEGYYRSGQSSPFSNVCLKIPDGALRDLLSWLQCTVLVMASCHWVLGAAACRTCHIDMAYPPLPYPPRTPQWSLALHPHCRVQGEEPHHRNLCTS